jgi:hypothetical protein
MVVSFLRDHHNLGRILTEIRTALLFRATAVSTGVMLDVGSLHLFMVRRTGSIRSFLERAQKTPLV